MREIQFRAKTKNGTWVYGYYVKQDKTTYCTAFDFGSEVPPKDNSKHYIAQDRMTDWGLPNDHVLIKIKKKTLGEYTGFVDKTGKRIFEGDILKFLDKPIPYHQVSSDYRTGVVVWDRGRFCIKQNFYCYSFDEVSQIEIIGNKHDNPELLKEEY